MQKISTLRTNELEQRKEQRIPPGSTLGPLSTAPPWGRVQSCEPSGRRLCC
jgi:hypothetical protein